MNANDLIAENFKLEDWLDGETKRFSEHVKPVKMRMDEIRDLLLAELLRVCGDDPKASISTDAGTAYKSTIVTPKIVDREKYLDFIETEWLEHGSEMLQLAAPQKDAVKGYVETFGKLPPGVETSSFTRVNLRRS